MPVHLVFKTSLSLSSRVAWETLLRTDTLKFVGKGFIKYYGTMPERWEIGQKMDLQPKLTTLPWSLLPRGSHTVEVRNVNAQSFTIQTTESGGVVKQWDHTMRIRATGDNCCEYTDALELDATWATGIVTHLARQLYTHRHAQWQLLAAEINALGRSL